MNSIERVWTALNLEAADRIPIHTIGLDGNLVDEVIGKPNRTAFDIFDEMEKQYPDDWVDKINGIIIDLEITVFSRAIEAASMLGFDACGAGYIPFKYESKSEITDIFGKRHKIKNNHGNVYPDYYGGYIKDRNDWERFPKPDFKEIYSRAKKFYSGVKRRCKKNNIDICIIAQDNLASVFPPVWQGMRLEYFVRALKNDPKLIEERFEQTTEFVLTVFKAYAECGANIFLEGGDIAYSSGPILSPRHFDKYLLPCYKRVTEAVHEWGAKIILHTDGNITKLLDFIVESGFDALQCLEPPFVDPYLVKKKIGNKLCLLGNIDTKHILVDATRQEVEIAVKEAIKALSHNGGFMISPANFHPAMSIERIKWMIEAAKKYGIYPLSEELNRRV
jgi:uroporphyrinogen decarboxylase